MVAFNPGQSEEEQDADESSLPDELTPEQKKKAARLLRDTKVKRDNSAMLGGVDGKRKNSSERVHDLFKREGLSPMTELVLLCKIERSKVYLWEKTIAEGGDLSALPKPDYKRYLWLLDKLVNYEVSQLKSIDITGKVDVGMQIQVLQFVPEQKVIDIDSDSPEKLRLMASRAGVATLPGATVKLVDSKIADIVKEAVGIKEEF